MNATCACFYFFICLIQLVPILSEDPSIIVIKFEKHTRLGHLQANLGHAESFI